jgi:ParB/RepB/Spo0J family partition protein
MSTRFAVHLIRVPERMRSRIDEDRVSTLATSMSKLGLMTPITVYIDVDDEGLHHPTLVAGHHRLRAAQQLGWNGIDCVLSRASETDRRLWEIAENLHRSELTVREHAEHVAEWVRLTDEKGGQLDHPGGAQPHSKGISAAARDLDVDRAEVRRAIKIDSITPEAKKAATDAKLDDNQSALLRVAAVPAEQQVEEVQRISSQRALSNMRREPTPEEKAHQEAVATIASYIVERVQDRPKHLKEITLDHVCAALKRAHELFANYDVEIG